MMLRRALGLLFSLALSVAWAGPLCAMPSGASHACCVGAGKAMPAPSPADAGLPACCRPADSAPATQAALPQAPVGVFLSCAVLVADAPVVRWVVPSSFVAASPQAPPGTHSGLSPPSSGL